jgi:DNA-binding MarR family transcriptional regulator
MHIRAAAVHLRRRSNQAFAPFGMTTDQYVLLTVLTEHRKATQQDLVARCFSDTATIGAMASLLEAKGLVTRMPHAQDRRALNVQLTQAGRRLAKELRRSSSDLRAELTSLFSAQELPMLIEFLGRLAGAMRPALRRTSSARSSRPYRTTGGGS